MVPSEEVGDHQQQVLPWKTRNSRILPTSARISCQHLWHFNGKKQTKTLPTLICEDPKQRSWVCYKVHWTNLYNLPALYPKPLCPTKHQLGCHSIPEPILRNFCKSMWRGGEAAEASCLIWCLSLTSKVTCLCLCIKRNDFTSSLFFRKWQNSTIQYLLLLFGNPI